MPDVKVKEWVGCLPCEQRHSGNLLISAAHASESPVWPTDGEGHCSGSGVVAVQANAAEGHY